LGRKVVEHVGVRESTKKIGLARKRQRAVEVEGEKGRRDKVEREGKNLNA
jgi:hypothetical protein